MTTSLILICYCHKLFTIPPGLQSNHFSNPIYYRISDSYSRIVINSCRTLFKFIEYHIIHSTEASCKLLCAFLFIAVRNLYRIFAARLIVQCRVVLSEPNAERVVPRGWAHATLEGCVLALVGQWARPESAARRLSIELTLKLIPALPAMQSSRNQPSDRTTPANQTGILNISTPHTRTKIFMHTLIMPTYFRNTYF